MLIVRIVGRGGAAIAADGTRHTLSSVSETRLRRPVIESRASRADILALVVLFALHLLEPGGGSTGGSDSSDTLWTVQEINLGCLPSRFRVFDASHICAG